MRAAVLSEFGKPLSVEERPAPSIGTGEVLVDVVATRVLPYADEVFSGARQYLLNTPVIPGVGAVGRVRAVGPDATALAVGDWVHCDPVLRSRDDARAPDIMLQGWSARGEGGLRIQDWCGDGSFAEQVVMPTENVFGLSSGSGAAVDPADASAWCALGTCLVPYGGLLAGGLAAGEIALVSGATGNYGGAGVAVALAMGARCVVAPGRNTAALDDLVARFGDRVLPVVLTGDEDTDRERMRAAAPGPIDLVLDLLPPSADPVAVRAAAMTVREYGRVILMGGVGMNGGAPLALPYPWIMRNSITVRGQWMCLPSANVGLIGLVHAGLLDLGGFAVTEFALDDVEAAVAHASAEGGRFTMTIVRPDR